LNCRQTQELISAYLDQELTGQQMLAMRAHLRLCPHCARECHETAEMRRLLRALPTFMPPGDSEQRLNARIASPEEPIWTTLSSAWTSASRPANPRGRRLAAALALSCVAILAVAPPFAPQAGDTAISSGSMATLPPLTMPPISESLGLSGTSGFPFLHMTLFHRSAPPANTSPPLPDMGAAEAEPLRDVTMVDYEQGNVALANYQASASGTR
jgi:hypothetical protein